MAIKDKLKATRIKKGYTQKQVGEITGICHTSIYRYEEGINQISVEALEKLANAYDISPVYLAEWRKYEVREPMKKLFDKLELLSEQQIKVIEDLINSFIENLSTEEKLPNRVSKTSKNNIE